VWGHAQAHLTAEMRAALATKLLQREADTRRSALSLDAKFAPDSPLEERVSSEPVSEIGSDSGVIMGDSGS